MTDIVERLTKYAVSSKDGNLRGPALDAAAEITRLRAQLAKADALAEAVEVLASSLPARETLHAIIAACLAAQVEKRK